MVKVNPENEVKYKNRRLLRSSPFVSVGYLFDYEESNSISKRREVDPLLVSYPFATPRFIRGVKK